MEQGIRKPIAELDGRTFDVAVIGGGINGASAAQHLAAAGYCVLLVDKGDFAEGASSRSSRVLHCGLRYLAPGASVWDFVRRPDKLRTACRMARQAMQDRARFVGETPERAHPTTFYYPLYRDGTYAPWQVKAAFRLLAFLGPDDVPLGARFLGPEETARTPLANCLRDPDDLRGVMSFQEFVFDWPERIVIDEVLDAERMGAVVRNYAALAGMERVGDGTWRLRIEDAIENETAEIGAKVVLNTAGAWIDAVNGLSPAKIGRLIRGTKGVNIMVRLAPECRGFGIAALNRNNEPIYCRPWHDLHYFGPTETVYEGDLDDIRAHDEEIEFLVDEANHALPALNVTRDEILYTWAGVRPLTFDESYPKGKRSRDVHDLSDRGLPGVIALTAGPITTHRSAGRELCAAVRARIPPSRPPQDLSYGGRAFPGPGSNAEPLLADHPRVTIGDLVRSAKDEHVVSLVDLLCRRMDVGWTATMGRHAARRAAEAVADVLGWDAARIESEVRAFDKRLDETHRAVGPKGV